MKTNRRSLFIAFLGIILLLLVQFCKTPDENEQNLEKWTSSDPLVVNFRIREQKYLHKNLIVNPSFEEGKIKKTDSTTEQINLDGWEIIGNSVKWTNPASDSLQNDTAEVHSGKHSICVNRKRADETEEIGQGVLSDYIKVIPGNYLLTLYLNLKNIRNPKSRLGTKIFDAVDIRILYYDRNKLQIKGEQYSPYYNTTVNISFKGFSFSNFDKIDSTGWIHITGRSQLFPFPDGDLPDNSKFVRIFIGLKGTGRLWADDIRFEYTRYNFTMLERLDRYFDSTFTKNILITPLPRKVSPRESVIYYRPYKAAGYPQIIVPNPADKITMNAARKLEDRIRDLIIKNENIDSTSFPKLIKKDSEINPAGATLTFSIGKTELYSKYKNKLPLYSILNQEQGYFIYSVDELSNIVFIFGNSPEANLYAVQSVLQLFDNKRTLFHNMNIIDYPAKNKRAMLLHEFKPNTVDQFYNSDNCRFNYLYLPGNSDSVIAQVNKLKEEYYSKKYIYVDLPDPSLKLEQLARINEEKGGYLKSFDGIAFLYNSPFVNGITLENLLNRYNSDSQSTKRDYDVNPLLKNLNNNKLAVEFLPCCGDNLYVNKFGTTNNCIENQTNKKSGTIWSGYGLQSWCMDEADLIYYKNQTATDPILLDLTMYSQDEELNYFANDTISPYKLMTSSLFDAFSNEIVPEIYLKLDKTILVYDLSDVFERIRMQTASDFFWNPANYNPDLSLYKALISEFGVDVTQDLLNFNDQYFKIRSEIILADNQKNKHRHIRRAFILFDELKIIQNKLKSHQKTKSVTEVNNILDSLINELDIKMKGFQRPPLLNLKNYQP